MKPERDMAVPLDAGRYSAVERLRDGRAITIRAQKPSDRDELVAAVARVSAQSFYLRFFSVKHEFSDKEVGRFMNIDFLNHVALVAAMDTPKGPEIVAGGRYVVVRLGAAEVAFAVLDEYQGLGIGALLMRHLTMIARAAGLEELVAEVLAPNRVMLKVFERSGLPLTTTREAEVVHVSMRIC